MSYYKMVSAVKIIFFICVVLLIIGGLNWGLYAINPSADLVAMIAGTSVFAKIIYALIAAAAVVVSIMSFTNTADVYSA